MPVDCPRCGTTHNLHGDCLSKPTIGVVGPSPYPPLPPTGNFQFNELHISRLDVKVDGHTEHLFIAILNGSTVGQVIALFPSWGGFMPEDAEKPFKPSEISRVKVCQLRMLYVMPVHRHKGVATRLFQAVEQFAKRENATQLELCVLKGNTPGRQFWIRNPDREAGWEQSSEYACMVRTL